jgi:hypothetical protein
MAGIIRPSTQSGNTACEGRGEGKLCVKSPLPRPSQVGGEGTCYGKRLLLCMTRRARFGLVFWSPAHASATLTIAEQESYHGATGACYGGGL